MKEGPNPMRVCCLLGAVAVAVFIRHNAAAVPVDAMVTSHNNATGSSAVEPRTFHIMRAAGLIELPKP
ncbi:MAG: hypothetical protein QM718_14070 [Steroidobacteraceae bacterium]